MNRVTSSGSNSLRAGLRTVVRPLLVVCLALLGPVVTLAQAEKKSPTLSVDFRRDVFPILSTHCFECHRGNKAKSGYRLDLRDELLGETNGVPLVIAGKSGSSRLIEVVSGRDPETVMPPKGARLTDHQVDVLRRWIDGGLEWDDALLPPLTAESTHWAFQPIRRPAVPSLGHDDWSLNPVDRFVAAKHRELGLSPSPDADRRTLLRRLAADLVGLPPSRAEVVEYERDDRADAFARLVDRFLNSPEYGERWGRHWLDVARWAESEGFESNHPRPFAWRYRDYVVDSFNRDRPFDEFVRQQIAGDEIVPYSDENLIATGFLAAARISSNEEDKWLQRNDVNVDIANAVGSALLGLTLHCAQCHNHKFDPITIRDYYQLQAFFVRGQPANVRLSEPHHLREYQAGKIAEYEPALALKQTLLESAKARLIDQEKTRLTPEERAAVETPADQRSVEQERLARKIDLRFQKTMGGIEKAVAEADRTLYNEVKKRLADMEKQSPPIPQTFAFYSPVTSPHELTVLSSLGFYPLPFQPETFAHARSYIMIRGDVHAIGPSVRPGVPGVLAERGASRHQATPATSDSGTQAASPRELTRRDLAEWLTSPGNPLVARVWVNRVWQYHFGRGLVATPDDFGVKGDSPSHPELLDWLAAELTTSGWSTKHIQRLILTSHTYRQIGRRAVDSVTNDPDNKYLTRWKLRRLEAEVYRDVLLSVTGELDRRLGGMSVPVESRDKSFRRALYQFQRRGRPPEMLGLFDGPNESAASCPQRTVSTTPASALFLLNDPFWLERAKQLAKSLTEIAGDDHERFVEAALLQVVQRPPTEAERVKAVEFLHSAEAGVDQRELLCHVLINLTELSLIE